MATQSQIIAEVLLERNRQDLKWGVPDHGDLQWLAILVEEVGEVSREMVEGLVLTDRHTEEMRKELIQVAAVAVAWVEAIDRRSGGG